jgi:AraC-like DNA-binding protein
MTSVALPQNSTPLVSYSRHQPGSILEAVEMYRRVSEPKSLALERELKLVLQVVHEHFYDPQLNVTEARKRVGSKDHNLTSRFRYTLGVSLRDYIEAVRLEAACHLLLSTGFPALHISSAVGFSSPQTFYSAFRRRFHLTPTLLRQRARDGKRQSLRAFAPEAAPLCDAELEVLAAAFDRVLPLEGEVGARTSGVVDYVRSRIESGKINGRIDGLRRGIALLDTLASGLHGVTFLGGSDAERDRVLAELRMIPHPLAQRFLVELIQLALAGFLCHPRHRGNRGGIGWRWLGYTGSAQG